MPDPLLHFDRIAIDGADPDRSLLFLHGIFGAGRNWNAVARRFVRERPEWEAVPVDLRAHGSSPGFGPPHTIRAAAHDLHRLVREAGLGGRAVLGHSFGGKVGLVYARRPAGRLEDLWVVDSTPAAREPGGSAWAMLEVLEALPGPFADRSEAVEAMAGRGVARPVALWMATNLERTDGALGWRIDPGVMRSLLEDFFRTDAWDVVEDPPSGLRIHFVKAEDSRVLEGAAIERVERAARSTGRVHLHRVRGGHWLNADNPEALVTLLARETGR